MTDHDNGEPIERRIFGRQARFSSTGKESENGGIGQLLDRQAPDEYRREWTERVAAANADALVTPESILVFRIGEEWLGLPTRTIREITRANTVHSLPHRNGLIMGLVCIRSQLTICISLASLLGIDVPNSAGTWGERQLVVFNWENSLLAFPVDQVQGIHRFRADELRPVPSTLAEAAIIYTSGILPCGERSVACLDDQLMIHTINRNLS